VPDDLSPEEIEAAWRNYLDTGDERDSRPALLKRALLYRLFRRLPSAPRCRLCFSPFHGIGGHLSRILFNRVPSKLNPQMCNACEQFAAENHGGAEVELSVLFADVRGSTTLAEGMRPRDFSQLISRFYDAATHELFNANAIVEKFMGDAVTGLFVRGLAGPEHPAAAVRAARGILAATGHRDPAGPWVPVGIGVHTGRAYLGAVGGESGTPEIAALGDAVNVGARLASLAGSGQALVSAETAARAGLDTAGLEPRELQLKGRTEAVRAWVLPA
jgi:adenylate cyclase